MGDEIRGVQSFAEWLVMLGLSDDPNYAAETLIAMDDPYLTGQVVGRYDVMYEQMRIEDRAAFAEFVTRLCLHIGRQADANYWAQRMTTTQTEDDGEAYWDDELDPTTLVGEDTPLGKERPMEYTQDTDWQPTLVDDLGRDESTETDTLEGVTVDVHVD